MLDAHFGLDVLKGFILGDLSAEKSREVVRHLLNGCRHCKKIAESLGDLTLMPDSPRGQAPEVLADNVVRLPPRDRGLLDQIRQREAMLINERQQAQGLLDELKHHPMERQFMLVANSRRFATWGLCERIIQESWESRFDDSATTIDLAQVAVVLAEGLDMDRYGMELVQDLKARAWAHLANAHKVGSDFHSAEEALEVADLFLDQGTGDPLEKATVLCFKASLRTLQERLDDAESLYDRVIAIYEEVEDWHSVGAVLLNKGLVAGQSGDFDRAIQYTRRSLEHLEKGEDERLCLAARHNLVRLLHENGDMEEALAQLQEIRPLYARLGDRLNLLQLSWLEGHISLTLGRTAVAEKSLLQARSGYLRQGIGYAAAEISLELAILYARRGQTRDLRQLASQMAPIFHTADVHQQAGLALLLFQESADLEEANVELLEEILAYLKMARDNPELPFRPRS